MLPAAIISVLITAAAAPYTDTQQRFSLTLPEGWGLAPRFGQTEGMRFSRKLADRHGAGQVFIGIEAREQVGVSEWIRSSSQNLTAAGHKVRPSDSQVGGRPSRRVRAVKGRAVIRCDYLPAGAWVFRLCVQGTRRDLRLVESDVKVMLQSFRPKVGADPSADVPIAPLAPTPIAAPLLGRFKSDAGSILQLHRDGRFALGPAEGVFEAQDDLLVLITAKGKRIEFRYVLSRGTLTLTSSRLGKPAVYQRIKARASADPIELTGTWGGAGTKLVLKPDGNFTLGAHEGKWVAEGDKLRLRRRSGEVVSYKYRLSSEGLALSGGDLDDVIRLKAQR